MFNLCIVIVHYDTPDLLKECLNSTYKLDVTNYKVIVVDNNSHLFDKDHFANTYPDISFIRLEKNYGFSYANNIAINLIKARNYLLLNPDTIIIDSRMSVILHKLNGDISTGIIGCKLLNLDYTYQKSTGSFLNMVNVFINFSGIKYFKNNNILKFLSACFFMINKRHFERYNNNPDNERYVDMVWGAFFMVKKSVFDQIGLLDDNFFLGLEESEFCYRAKKNNIRVLYYPKYSIIHHFNASVKKNRILSVNAQLNGCLYYVKKHFPSIKLFFYKAILILSVYARLLLLLTGLLNRFTERKAEINNIPNMFSIIRSYS